MAETNNTTQIASFDGIIKGWPEELPLSFTNIPKNKKDFVLYMACELYKVQNISNPNKQAKNSIDNAKSLYDALKSKGYID